jgi:2-octaprenyl-6-methoxyphenol hydroxylase
MTTQTNTATLDLAVVGAGPAGLTLALLAAERLPDARITVYDARALDRDVSADARTLALSLGSVQLLERLRVWPAAAAQPIDAVHVSQAPPSWDGGRAAVSITAAEQGVSLLGAVLSYGALVAPLQAAWLALVQADPGRLSSRFGVPVHGVRALKCRPGLPVPMLLPTRPRHSISS